MSDRRIYDTLSRIGKFFQPLLSEDTDWMKIPIWSKTRLFPKIAKTSFHDYWKKNENITNR
jgi:hypothetical protein